MIEYKLKRQIERVGDLEVPLSCLENLNETIDRLFEALSEKGDASLLETLCPYFGTIWPSARALAETMVEEFPRTSGATVLEVGCGLALPGIVAARLGAKVTATDFHPEVPRFLEANLAANAILPESFRYVRVDWKALESEPEGSETDGGVGRFDWVIASDVLYERQHAEQVARIVTRHVKPGGRIVLADPARPYLQNFVDEMRRQGFVGKTAIRKVADDPVPKEIFVLSFTAP